MFLRVRDRAGTSFYPFLHFIFLPFALFVRHSLPSPHPPCVPPIATHTPLLVVVHRCSWPATTIASAILFFEVEAIVSADSFSSNVFFFQIFHLLRSKSHFSSRDFFSRFVHFSELLGVTGNIVCSRSSHSAVSISHSAASWTFLHVLPLILGFFGGISKGRVRSGGNGYRGVNEVVVAVNLKREEGV
ncbi:putative phosphatidylinositol3phosphate 5kinase [Sesbania bispinosa]|nr:putative phosphatidylinositol3phosphate 5kinase [Sesbania bispinosa]